ncbi:hypothetical protein [Halioxenophilus sp. WMMB6]|uniref:hypothetical protein n=1 Tax=Halioxenophilus sp. WMMB6 TaxID=3073815 RepID=UPI00295F508B|nr:hypothetical protein [Halioxenophilus sp. WMMB6]
MRVALGKRAVFSADLYCRDSRSAKKALNELVISVLAVDFSLHGRDNSCVVLRWAQSRSRLPNRVVLTESDRSRRAQLGTLLNSCGYRSIDGANFYR